jgi:CheY-like chemotaxis protein
VEVRLPLMTEVLPATSPPRMNGNVAGAGSAKRSIVIVEDNADGRESLRFLLELWGHEVRTAADGPQGLDAILALEPDVALVDIGLPGMTGYELVRQLRKSSNWRPHLIAMTGYGQPHDRQLALESGFDSFVIKPIDALALHELLGRCPSREPMPVN